MSCLVSILEACRDYSPKELYSEIVSMVEGELGCVLTQPEKDAMKLSDQRQGLWSDFVPKKHSGSWYNVRIGCQTFSLILRSDHPGFKAN